MPAVFRTEHTRRSSRVGHQGHSSIVANPNGAPTPIRPNAESQVPECVRSSRPGRQACGKRGHRIFLPKKGNDRRRIQNHFGIKPGPPAMHPSCGGPAGWIGRQSCRASAPGLTPGGSTRTAGRRQRGRGSDADGGPTACRFPKSQWSLLTLQIKPRQNKIDGMLREPGMGRMVSTE